VPEGHFLIYTNEKLEKNAEKYLYFLRNSGIYYILIIGGLICKTHIYGD